jgi:hypothetical protein
MTLDDRSRLLHPKHRTGECLRQTGYKEAILIDLLEMLKDEPFSLEQEVINHEFDLEARGKEANNKLRQELRNKANKKFGGK